MNHKQDFTQGSIFGKMIRFMLPILAALILQAMYGAVDLLIVGRFGTTAGVSAVATGSSILNLVTFVLCALATGVTVLMGRYLGEGTPKRIGPLLGSAIVFFLILTVILSAALLIFARPIALLMQAPAEALDLTIQYIRICGGGFVFVVAYNLISCVFRGLGNSKFPLIFVSIACVVNIIGDLILVAGLGLNVMGAAIATITAQAVSVLLSLVIIRRQSFPFSISRKDLRLGVETRAFLQIGTPLALQELLTNLSFLALCAFINHLGLDASSGYGVAQKIQSFIMLLPSSIIQCMASFVAQNVGAGKEDRAKRGMVYGMAVGSLIGALAAGLVFFYGDMVASVFTTDPAAIGRAFEFLRGFALDAVLTNVLFAFMGYFNGHGKSLFVMIQGLIQSFLIRLPMSYIMSIQPDASLTGVGLAAPAATVVGIALCLWYYKRMQKELISQ